MKVLHFVSSPSKGSGVMSVIMNYYRHINRDRIQFDFLCFLSDKNSYEVEILGLGGTVYYVPKPTGSPASVRALNRFFRVHVGEYEWLHNHEVYLSFLLRPLSKRWGIQQFIVHCHATKYSDKPLSSIRNHFLCVPIKFMKCKRFACSRAAGEFLYGKRMVKYSKVIVLPNAIEYQHYQFNDEKRQQVRNDLGIDGKFVIGHVGRFEKQKNHKYLVDIFAEVKKQRDNGLLLLIGDGSLRTKIEQIVQKKELSKSVMFLGQKDDVAALLQGIDVFVLPSLFEGLPVSCIEAQVAGVPCVISDTITEESKLYSELSFVPLKDKKKWVLDILRYHHKSINRKSKIVSKQFDIDYQATRLEKIYEYYKVKRKND